jgi:hypothetical protein
MRILPKTLPLLLAFACSTPWHNEPVNSEVNLAFTLERNLVTFTTMRIDGRAGRFILASAAPRTILDPSFANPQRRHLLHFGQKETLALSNATPMELGGVADALIGADVWNGRAISIDYHSGLVSFQKEGIVADALKLYRYPAEPMIEVDVNGRVINAIVDTTNPDTLVLPSPQKTRGTARVRIAGNDFGNVDIQYANVSHARVGNRLLSHFLVTIDYGQRLVGLWRDPRNPV